MTRPTREIADRADVLADPAAHWPQRPAWTCDADGEPWPCEALRNHLHATLPAQSIGVAMGAHYIFAVRELDEPPAAVHDRLLGWIRAG